MEATNPTTTEQDTTTNTTINPPPAPMDTSDADLTAPANTITSVKVDAPPSVDDATNNPPATVAAAEPIAPTAAAPAVKETNTATTNETPMETTNEDDVSAPGVDAAPNATTINNQTSATIETPHVDDSNTNNATSVVTPAGDETTNNTSSNNNNTNITADVTATQPEVKVENQSDIKLADITTTNDQVSQPPQKIINNQQTALPTRQYLDATVVPILHSALSQLAKLRPEDPILFLSEYLKDHKDTYATEQKCL